MSSSGNGRGADILVLGAGVMGTSIAFQLARRKAGRIVIIDKDHVGRGASGRSSALIRMHYTFPPEVQLAVKSLEMFENWRDLTGQPGDFRRTGFLQLVPAEQIELLKANVEMQRRNGVRVELLSAGDVKKIEPDWYVDDIVAAAYEPDSGYGDGSGVANDFLSKARELGVEYQPRTQVTNFLVKDGCVRLLQIAATLRQGWSSLPQANGANRYSTRPRSLFQLRLTITKCAF
jgi:sarcosine oxidase subunit beta